LKFFKFLCVAKPRKEIRAAYFVGYYGFGNAGDEHLLRQAQKLVVAEMSYVLPSRRLLGLWDMSRRMPFVDAVVFGGGSLFQDKSSSLSLAYYLLILTWACLWRRRVVILGHGLGPICSRGLSRWLSCLLPHVDNVVARDAQSYTDFLALGSRPEGTVLGTDLAYLAGCQPDLWDVDGVVAVSVNGPILPMFESALPSAVAALLWISMHAGHDETREPHVQMTADLSLDRGGLGPAIPETLEGRPFDPVGIRLPSTGTNPKFRACIAMRYHACVWASLRGIPFLAVGDDPKLKALATMFGQPMVSLSRDRDAWGAEILRFLAEGEYYRQRLLVALLDVLADAKKTDWY